AEVPGRPVGAGGIRADRQLVLRARQSPRRQDRQRARQVAAAPDPSGGVQGRLVLDAQGILGAVAQVDERNGDVVISMSDDDPIIRALEEQVECYRRLAKLAQVQHVHVQQSQTEALLDVLKNRQTELTQIARLEHQIAPAKKAWPQFVGALAGDRRDRAERLMSETRRLLEEITEADKDDVLVLQQRKLSLGRQIN